MTASPRRPPIDGRTESGAWDGTGAVAGWAVAGLAAVLLVAYVLGAGGQTEAFRSEPCAPFTELPAGVDPPGHTVLLMDRSRSARGAPPSAGEAGDYAALLVAEVQRAVDEGDTVSIAGFDGSRASIQWQGSTTLFQGNAERGDLHRESNRACLTEELRDVRSARPAAEGTDVLGALRVVRERLDAVGAHDARVVVATDALATVGCASVVGTGLDPAAIGQAVEACRMAGELPDLSGVEVTLLGVGQPGPGLAVLRTTEIEWLRRLWTELCAATGGTCTLATPEAAPADRIDPLPADAPVDPDPDFPAADVVDAGPLLVVGLPASLLFDSGSPALRPDAGPELDRALATLIAREPQEVRVEGHTDSRGEPTDNFDLSQRRAQAVADALAARGIAVTAIVGLGETRLRYPDEFLDDGTPDLDAMAGNRRVEIVATVPEQPAP